MQVEVEAALADLVAGELAGVGGQGGQLDALEAGGDVEAVQRSEGRQLAADAHRGVAVDLAADVHSGRLRGTVVDTADAPVQLLDGGGEVGGQREVGEVCRAVADLDAADPYLQRRGWGIISSWRLVLRSSLMMKRA